MWLGIILLCGVSGGAETRQIQLHPCSSSTTSPSGYYRWLDAANHTYASSFRESYSYENAQVTVSFNRQDDALWGTLDAVGLKPNFAYQLKLVGTPGTVSNHRIGLRGRWWEEEWLESEERWGNGWNLNSKGDGLSPTPNDETYLSRMDESDTNSPTGKHYRYTAYLIFGYFITGPDGEAHVSFRADNSYHVLWKPSQRTRSASDGPLKTAQFDPETSNPAYDQDYSASNVSVFGEWERLPKDDVLVYPGAYEAELMLTEESFHGDGGTYAGTWAGAMSAEVEFHITAPDTVPNDGDGNGITDAWERFYFTDSPADPKDDHDGDGLTNVDEFREGTRPKHTDTDGDGQPDGWEVQYGLQPADPGDKDRDPDSDGLTNKEEFAAETNPRDPDTDADQMPDGWEVTHNLPARNAENATADTDGDGFSDLQEYQNDTDPRQYALVLQPGWNLISLARAPEDCEIQSLFPNQKITASWRWNEDEQRYAEARKLVPLEGCWIHYDAEEKTVIPLGDKSFPSSPDTDGDGLSDQKEREEGRNPHRYVITLTPGWNLVSLCRVPNDHSVEAIFGNAAHPRAWTWRNGRYRSTETLKPLRGYWIYSGSAEQVDVDISIP